MIREIERPLLPEEATRVRRSLAFVRRSLVLFPIGRLMALLGIWLLAMLLASSLSSLIQAGGGVAPDGTGLMILLGGASLLVLVPGIPIVAATLRRDFRNRAATIALYERILVSQRIPVVEVEATRIIRFVDVLRLGDCFLCEVNTGQCLFLIGVSMEEVFSNKQFPAARFEVVSYGAGQADTTIRPLGPSIEAHESISAVDILWPDWQHAELLEQSLDECMAALRKPNG